MGNGALWVYTGLMREMSDDELAIVLGHELAHYTHEGADGPESCTLLRASCSVRGGAGLR